MPLYNDNLLHVSLLPLYNDNLLHVSAPSHISLQREFSYLFITSSGPSEHHQLYYQIPARPPTARPPDRSHRPQVSNLDRFGTTCYLANPPSRSRCPPLLQNTHHTTHHKLRAGHPPLLLFPVPILGSSGSLGFYSVYPRKRELVPCS